MERVMVLGIGNRLMMDDGIGIYLVEELSKQNKEKNIEYIVGESDVDYCIEMIERVHFVIILDTMFTGKNPGEITVYQLNELEDNRALSYSPHDFHLFQYLFHQKANTKGIIIGIEPFEIGFQLGLSDALKEKWECILHKVKNLIDNAIRT